MRRSCADREAQDGWRLPQLRLRPLQGADRGGAARASHAHERGFRHCRPSYPRSTAAVHVTCGSVIAAIAPNDSVERFTGLGVQVIQAAAAFLRQEHRRRRRQAHQGARFVIATGSSPAIPPIPGLDSVPYFTNETIFDNRQKLDHLVVIGGGSIGLELAQAYLRLGSRVTVLEAMKALGKDDPELSEVVLKHVARRGRRRARGGQGRARAAPRPWLRVTIATAAGAEVLDGSHILWRPAARQRRRSQPRGRRHQVRPARHPGEQGPGHLQFPRLRHRGRHRRPAVHACRRLSRRHRLPPRPVPPAREGARRLTSPGSRLPIPSLPTSASPSRPARDRHGPINVYRWPFHENDRAQAERATQGFVKVVTDKKGRILGASIVGAQAGELIQIWSLAISQGLKISAMTQWVCALPDPGRDQQAGGDGILCVGGRQSAGAQGGEAAAQARLVR